MLLKNNIIKLFFVNLTDRRSYISLLSIYFLTLPNATANQIGIYNLIGALAGFLLEVPSGYISDKFGHKNTLIFSKIIFFLSTLCFILADSLFLFILGATFLAIGFSFTSGTFAAFTHETLRDLKKEHLYTKTLSKINANASLVSAIIMTALPLLTSISLLLPFQITLVLDVIGILFACSLANTNQITTGKTTIKQMRKILKNYVAKGFYSLAIFSGAILGLGIVASTFRPVYLEHIGLSVTLVGLIYGFSRLIWFVIGHKVHILEQKISLKKLLMLETLFFPLANIIVVFYANIYFVIGMFSLTIGYMYARSSIYTNYFVNHLIKDKRYKATLLSVKNQISGIFHAVGAITVAYIMDISLEKGFLALGIILFVILVLSMKTFHIVTKKASA